jgi:hypothetical protein
MQDPIYQLLRREIERVAKEYEAMSYAALSRPAEELSRAEVVNGIEISFSAEACDVTKNGDICFCIDARAEPNRTGSQPSYRFFKRKDGSVYY